MLAPTYYETDYKYECINEFPTGLAVYLALRCK